MSSLSFLSVYLIRVSLILLLTAVSEAQHYEDSMLQTTPAPDYYSDYNGTFDYSFYSNTSIDDLEKFLQGNEGFIDSEGGGVDVYNAASLPVYLDIRMLVWTLMILHHTL